MTTTPPTPTVDMLPAAIAQAQTEMSRVDTKASMLLLGSLMSVSVAVALITKAHLPGPAVAAGLTAITLIAAAITLLITAVRPALNGNHGFVRWANVPTATDLATELTCTDSEHSAYQADQLLNLSRSVYRKYRYVRLATDLLRAALLAAVLTVVLTVAL